MDDELQLEHPKIHHFSAVINTSLQLLLKAAVIVANVINPQTRISVDY